jgi:lipopolysaccharide transport system permease protein
LSSRERALDLDMVTDHRGTRGASAQVAPVPVPDEVVIEPRSGWRLIDFRELRGYRDLIYYLTLRAIKARYAQSALGLGWAIVQPITTVLVFTLVFGRVARIGSDGHPYMLFAFCGLVPWNFFSHALSAAATSLTGNAQMLSKIYFPRLILPLTAVTTRLVDLAITLVMLAVMMPCFGYAPRPEAAVLLPLAIVVAMAAALGVGLWLSALAVQYRDVSYGLGFLIQIAMYLSPVIYSISRVPPRYWLTYSINPMAGVIAAFRAGLLGDPMHWDAFLVGSAVTAVLLVTGALYFRRRERVFADVA